jgi:uracil-DNA glycosylase family 4
MQLPQKNCALCPRLVAFREANQQAYPSFYNGVVPPFGEPSARLLVVGLAPGLKGANATGRPFTGDYAGVVLYEGLRVNGFTQGEYRARADDGFTLKGVRITNAVRCVPPENKPLPSEEKNCLPFLVSEIDTLTQVEAILCLGLTSHQAVLRTFKLKAKDYKFAHGARHRIQVGAREILLFNSYHTSRYNISTGRLTQAMFNEVVAAIKTDLD